MKALGFLTSLCLVLSACSSVQQTHPTPSSPPMSDPALLGVLRVDLSGLGGPTPQMKSQFVRPDGSESDGSESDGSKSDGSESDGSKSGGNMSAQTLEYINPSGLTLSAGWVSFDDDEVNGRRYLKSVLRLKNTSSLTLGNLTLHALSLSGAGSFDTLGGTAVSNLRDAAGNPITHAGVARAMQPTHGMTVGLGGAKVSPELAHLQAYSTAETAQVQSLYTTNLPGGLGKVLGYGFTASSDTGGRAILSGKTAQVALAYRLPLSSPRAQNPWSLSLYFVVTSDTETSVTQSLEEQDNNAGVVARAGGQGATVIRTLVGSTLTDSRAVSVCGGAYALNPATSVPEKWLSDPALVVVGSGKPDFCTFGNRGIVTTPLGSGNDFAKGLVLQPDGKIVVTGFSNNGTNADLALVRYTSSGALDPTFGSGGKVITPVGLGQDSGEAVALQSDGKIVVAGYSNNDFALVRYTSSGTLDTTFGSGGVVVTPIGSSSDGGEAVALQSDGKIVVAGYSFKSLFDADFALVRYTSSGALDTTFGSGGKVTTSFGTFFDGANQVAIQSDGKIVVAGTRSNGSTYEWALARYTSSGALDPIFGTGGKVTAPTGSATGASCGMALQSDGKIVIVGLKLINSTSDFAVLRYTSGGAPDTTFGSGGIVTTPIGSSSDVAQSVAIQSDSKIVVAGFNDSNFALVRYTSSGALDTGFGSGGKVTTSIGSSAGASSVALQSDGKIVVAGDSSSGSDADLAVVRYIP